MHSRLYVGQVKHQRYTPARHAFRYGLFMLYLDLAELHWLFNKRWLWSTRRPALARFKREDHLGDKADDLAAAVRDLVQREADISLKGPIRLLTNLRYFGYGFNPVSFYYCFDESGNEIEVIVAEVNDKRFHVSPFMDMNIDYDWRFNTPAEKLVVHMKNYQQGSKLFDATLSLQQQPINGINLAGALIRYPLMTVKIITAIHYQALRLWLKNVPFHPHPDKQEAPSPVRRT
jgi:DUF1365 family protein